MSKASKFNWRKFHAYRVFDEFLECFIIGKKSYVTHHNDQLNFKKAFEEIHSCFSEGYDDSKEDFESKVERQFKKASKNSKIVFANIEYLWAMPVKNIRPETKQSYALRWFGEDETKSGDRFFFGAPHTIANAGPWYLRNKYSELIALLRVLSTITKNRKALDLNSAKKQIADVCYSAIYEGGARNGRFGVERVCGVHSVLMHLAAPEKYGSIVSENHKERISSVFEHVISDCPDIKCREEKIRLIRERLYRDYGDEGDPDRKYRWFFYLDSLKPLWIDKKASSQQSNASIVDEVNREQAALDYREEEGLRESSTSYRVYRSAKLAEKAKVRDEFTCRACEFSFQKQIVHVHHLDPLSERLSPRETSLDDLVTLCPNCHYLAHFLLRKDDQFKKLKALLPELKKCLNR